MNIYIDQRIELITIIQTLCNYWDNLALKYFNNKLFQCEYKENIKQYFNKYKNNETIELYNKFCNDEMDISAFLTLVLNYSTPPEICKLSDYNGNKYDYFINCLRRFYKETDFNIFYTNNKNQHKKILEDFGNKGDFIEELKYIFDFLSIEQKYYEVIISPLVFGNFGINTNDKIYIIISPINYKDDKYIFGSKESVKNIIWHEISHTVINDLTKKYYNLVRFENIKIPEIYVNNLYNNWETIINEYIIRSITYLLEKDNNCQKALLEYEIKSGFNEIENIKNFIIENCLINDKFNKENNYSKLIDYVIERISKSYCT